VQRTKTLSVTLLSALTVLALAACGRDADVSKSTSAAPGTVRDSNPPPPIAIDVPFQERLSNMEKSSNACSEGKVSELVKIHTELHEIYAKEMHEAQDLRTASGVAKNLTPYFDRIRAISATCVQKPGLREREMTQLGKLSNADIQDSAVLHFLAESSDSCSAPEVENIILALKMQNTSPSSRASLRKTIASCGFTGDEKFREAEGKLALAKMHSSLQKATKTSCSLDSRYYAEESSTVLAHEFPSISRPTRGSKVLAAQLRVNLSELAISLTIACDPAESFEPKLLLQPLETELNAFNSETARCQNLGTLSALKIRAQNSEPKDLKKLASSRMKKEFQGRYLQLQSRIALVQQSCVEINEEERKRLEEEKRKELERKKIEELKRLEEEKRKQEELKRAEQEKRKESERKRIEEQQRKEQERKRIEEEKRKELERKRIEEQKRQEERKRAEQEKYRSVEEKRRKLTPPAWGDSPARKPWTDAVLQVVRARMSDFDKARDVETFCPGYGKAELHEQENCWLQIVAAVSKRESSFKADTSFEEGNGVDSIGLLALSAGECPNAPTAQALRSAIPNLTCGVNIMAKLVGRHGIIDGSNVSPTGKNITPARGASAYWSTLRPAYRVYHPKKQRWLNVGHKADIISHSRKYKLLRK